MSVSVSIHWVHVRPQHAQARCGRNQWESAAGICPRLCIRGLLQCCERTESACQGRSVHATTKSMSPLAPLPPPRSAAQSSSWPKSTACCGTRQRRQHSAGQPSTAKPASLVRHLQEGCTGSAGNILITIIATYSTLPQSSVDVYRMHVLVRLPMCSRLQASWKHKRSSRVCARARLKLPQQYHNPPPPAKRSPCETAPTAERHRQPPLVVCIAPIASHCITSKRCFLVTVLMCTTLAVSSCARSLTG